MRLPASGLFLLLSISTLVAQSPEIPPGHVLVDDMILPEEAAFGESAWTANSWVLGVVPYTFNANVSAANQALTLNAMNEISAVCGVVFIPRSSQPDWVVFTASTVNNSLVGRAGGAQTINITSWGSKFIIVHEIMHALGFLHEQSRPDRDNFVTINFGNISTSACTGSNCGGNGSSSCVCNFNIVNGATTATAYDFLSIMHYGRSAFTSNGADTITCKPAFANFQNDSAANPGIGNRSFMSLGDASGLRQRYGPPSLFPNLGSISPTTVTTAAGGSILTVFGSGFFQGSTTSNGVVGTQILWNGSPLTTTFVSTTQVRAVIPAALVALPQVVQIGISNPAPAWGSGFGTANLSVVCQTGALALANGAATTLTNSCQQFSITPTYNAFNVVGVTSPGADWDIQMGTASAAAGSNECDFVVGSGFAGAGTITPTNGNVILYSGVSPAVLQHVTSTEMLNGQPTIVSMPAGSIVRAFHFGAAAVSTRTIQIAGPTYLRWKLIAEGNSFAWRSSTTNVVASGQVGGPPVTGIGVVPDAYCLVVYSNGIPLPGPESFTITMCFDFTPAALVSSNFITTINQGAYSCVPFSIAPLTGRWNVVGVSSTTDWDIQMGTAVSQFGGSTCDYVLANGRIGTVGPLNGICSPYSPLGAPGYLQFGPTSTLPNGWYSYTPMIMAFEFEITTTGDYDIAVGGDSSYFWDFHRPGLFPSWRSASSRSGGPYPVTGPAVRINNLSPGWHCVVVYHNGGPTGLTSPSISIGYATTQIPVASSLSPATAPAGSGALLLRVLGNHFTANSAIVWNGGTLTTTFVSATELQATVAASLLATPGSANVAVSTPGVGASQSLFFTIPALAPTLTSLAPTSVAVGGASFTLWGMGSGYNSGSILRWNGTPLATNFVNGTTVNAQVGANLIATAGSALISVENPGAGISAEVSLAISGGVPGFAPIVGPGLEPVQTWSATAMGIPTPLGGVSFNAAATQLIVAGGSNSPAGALYSIPVTRDPTSQRILGLGQPVYLAPAPSNDGGLAERNGTWFYSQHPANSVGQWNGATGYSSPLPIQTASTGGLTFVPAGSPNAGTLLVSSFGSSGIWSVNTSSAGSGFLNMGTATLYAAVPAGNEGIAFIPSGPRAGDLLIANYSQGTISVLDVNPQTGLPVGGTANPSISLLVPQWIGAEGVTVDPVTGDLWLTQYGDGLLQIAGLDTLQTLVATSVTPSFAAGARISFRLRAGTAQAGSPYILGGSLSGSSPGTPIGNLVLPLNIDSLTNFILMNLNQPPFIDFSGPLLDHGTGNALFVLPAAPGLTGLSTTWAYLLLDPVDFVSNPLVVQLVP